MSQPGATATYTAQTLLPLHVSGLTGSCPACHAGGRGELAADVAHEATFELDAQRGSDATADVAEVLFALSWPPAVTASIVR